MKTSAAVKYRILFTLLVVAVFGFATIGDLWGNAYAQEITKNTPAPGPALLSTPYYEVINPYFSIQYLTLADGTSVSGYIINGPPFPLPNLQLNARLPSGLYHLQAYCPTFRLTAGFSAVRQFPEQ